MKKLVASLLVAGSLSACGWVDVAGVDRARQGPVGRDAAAMAALTGFTLLGADERAHAPVEVVALAADEGF